MRNAQPFQFDRTFFTSLGMIAFAAALVVGLGGSSGCAGQRKFWRESTFVEPLEVSRSKPSTDSVAAEPVVRAGFLPDGGPTTWITAGQLRDETERRYAVAMAAFVHKDYDAATHEAFHAAAASWKWIDLHSSLPPGTRQDTPRGPISAIPPTRAIEIYHSAVTLLINSAQRSGRLNPAQGVWLDSENGPQLLRINYHGFAWQPEDFTYWLPVGEYSSTRVVNVYRRQGWGVPLVIVREMPEQTPFMAERIPFPATAMLRPSPPSFDASALPLANEMPYALELFEPRSISAIEGRGSTPAALAADLSAPMAWIDNKAPRRYLEAFRQPDEGTGRGQLQMFEPYQPGKIPVVLIHGLLSEPLAWIGLANELAADPEFTKHYQIWAFRYPTGKSFLASGAELRSDLRELIGRLSAQGHDPALQHCVLIGHSMGGLLSKLQVTHSNHHLWNAFANQPLDNLTLDERQREHLRAVFFFEPQPFVQRVIFIGTPHDGSGLASTWLARLGIDLVRRRSDIEQEYQQLLDNNPGVVNPQFTKHMPTSVDLLQPEDDLLQSVRRLPVAPHVSLHSIVGVGYKVPFAGDGDGAVPRESARHPGSETEFFVNARHEHMHSHPNTVAEIKSILRLHIQTVQSALSEMVLLDEALPEQALPEQALPEQKRQLLSPEPDPLGLSPPGSSPLLEPLPGN